MKKDKWLSDSIAAEIDKRKVISRTTPLLTYTPN